MVNRKGQADSFIRIPPYHYVHVKKLQTHVTRIIMGPLSYALLDDETLVSGPSQMITLSCAEYCIIRNPVIMSADGEPVVDNKGQVKVRFGQVEYRFHQDPFPLYPGEKVDGYTRCLPVITANDSLRLRALVDFTDENGTKRGAGDEWIFVGPATYYPRKEVEVISTDAGHEITLNTALCVSATKDFIDKGGVSRICGEKWLVPTLGMYFPDAYEKVVEKRSAYQLTDEIALYMKALGTHTDVFGKRRRCGDEWLITRKDSEAHICGVLEEVVKEVKLTVLNLHQYCVILNPLGEDGLPQLGRKKLVRGDTSFFLYPGESLESGVQNSYILSRDEGLILRAEEQFSDEVCELPTAEGEPALKRQRILRYPGDQWMIRGPQEYVPPTEVVVLAQRKLIPLDGSEGIYVRNCRTGEVRAVIGEAYMLNQDEELWEKKLPTDVIKLLEENRDAQEGFRSRKPGAKEATAPLDLTKVITYQIPHNAVVQIFDNKLKSARVELGPTLVMLQPEEQFTKLSLSGSVPKQPNQVKSLCLLLGPDFFVDQIMVETADHARLALKLAYKWHFPVPDISNQLEAAKLFSVRDFVGDASKALSSRIREVVTGFNFDDFHKQSASIIRSAVFGKSETGEPLDNYVFSQNNLHISGVDIQSIEPDDVHIRESLKKSVQLAIEIIINSQEASAKHRANRIEQEAQGSLEKQKIEDETAIETARRSLLETRIELATLESSGQAKAEAQSRVEAARIEGEAAVERAKLRAQAVAIETQSELERLSQTREAEVRYAIEKDNMVLKRKSEEANIEINRFKEMVNAIGSETIRSIATASSDHNLRMLSALGLQSTLITDGSTPINLLTTAHGLIGQLAPSISTKMDSTPKAAHGFVCDTPRPHTDQDDPTALID